MLYLDIESKLVEGNIYTPIDLVDFTPKDRLDRQKWIDKFKLSVPTQMYTYYQGNYLGNIHFVWKLPEEKELRSDDCVCRIVADIHKQLPKYATRAMRRTFFNRYSQCDVKPVVMRDMFHFLTDDKSASLALDQAEIDQCMAEFLATDDPELLFDLRKLNGNPGSTKYNIFWEALDKYFNESILAVQERRHGDYLFMPFAISTEHLRDTIAILLM